MVKIENIHYNMLINNPKLSIYSLMIGTLLCGYWGLFGSAPGGIKMLFAASIYVCLLSFPYKNCFQNDYGLAGNFFLLSLIVSCIYQILVSVINFDPDMYAFGNKYVTLFLNENCAPLLFPPLFCYYAVQKENLYILIKAISIYIVVSLIMVGLGRFVNFAFTPIFLTPFFFYVNKKIKVAIIAACLFGIYYAKYSARMMLIVVAFAFASLIVSYLLNRKFVKLIFCSFVISLPFLFFVPILKSQLGAKTPIQEMMELVVDSGDEENDATDTRSYMYIEMALDLTNTNSWIFGKGAYSHYYSEFEHQNFKGQGVDYGRVTTEVPFLNYLLRGGIVYVFLYLSLFVVAIFKGIFYGKNKYICSIVIITTGWFFNSFIGDTEGCRFYHLVFFFLVGCCFSKSILQSSDIEIQAMLDNQYRKLMLLKKLILLKLMQKKINSIKS